MVRLPFTHFLFLFFCLFSATLSAQNRLVIHRNDGQNNIFESNEIDSIRVNNQTPDPEFIVYPQGQSPISIPTSAIDSISYPESQGCPAFVNDVDGNFYTTTNIGGMCWMRQNLRTTRYADGSSIPNLSLGTDWESTNTGAYCVYNNDIANRIPYGYLYNCYSIYDERNVCPAGWHVATNDDWSYIGSVLGGNSIAGGALKTLDLWESPNWGASNSVNFDAVPAGIRASDATGTFGGQFQASTFWAFVPVSQLPQFGVASRSLNYQLASLQPLLGITTDDYNLGYSVRCVKD